MKAVKLALILFLASFLIVGCSLDSLTGKKENEIFHIRIEGLISDGSNGQAVKDALIEINQEKNKSDEEGRFVIPSINLISPVLSPPIKITAEGYHAHYSILEVSKKEVRYKYKECTFQLMPHRAPHNLRASAGDTRVRLKWNPPLEGNPIGYNVYLQESNMPINAEPLMEFSYIDLGLTNGVEHIYFVRAIVEKKEDGTIIESPNSNRVKVTPMPIKFIGEREAGKEKEKSMEKKEF